MKSASRYDGGRQGEAISGDIGSYSADFRFARKLGFGLAIAIRNDFGRSL